MVRRSSSTLAVSMSRPSSSELERHYFEQFRRVAALAYCHGTPLRGEIEACDPNGLRRATHAAEAELARRFGDGPIEGHIEALVVTVSA
jgi:hypothetical protein